MGQKLIDETGNVYGSLTVIKPIRKPEMRKTYWLCQCSCGNTIMCNGSELRANKRTSCGKHCNNIVDETGKHYGFLQVLKRDPTPASSFSDNCVHWICKCELYNSEKSISGRNLRNGQVKSCGCLKSTGEQYILKYLNSQNKILYQKEFSFSDLVDINPLRFDFALFNQQNNLLGLIEFQGRQHFQEIDYFNNNKDSFKKRLKRDKQKEEYCIQHNIPLLKIIPYDYNHPELSDYESIGILIEEFLIEIKGEHQDVKIFNKFLRNLQSRK